MPGLFQGIEIGKSALLSHQLNLQTIGHNIANVNTPGYSRQRVTITSAYPELSTVGNIGQGVRSEDVRHIRDLFLGQQLREEQKSMGQWTYKEKILTRIEGLFNEPNDNTIADRLNEFWNAWSDLNNAGGESVTARDGVVEMSILLTESMHELHGQLLSLQDSIDLDMVNLTSEINRLNQQIAKINDQVKRQELGSVKANDLRDQRDRLIDDLSNIIDVNVREKPNGEAIVYIGAMTVVDGRDFLTIDAEEYNYKGSIRHRLVWSGTDVELKNINGELAGLTESRDDIVGKYIGELDELAGTLVREVNRVHSNGYDLNNNTNIQFFDPRFTDAGTIRVNPAIVRDGTRIAAASNPDAVGDTSNVLEIWGLKNQRIADRNTATLNEFYDRIAGSLGVETKEAITFLENYQLLVHQLDTQKQAVQGVSLDEEMANMVKFQHAYDAAARVVTTMDEALNTVINGMGLVGR